jgi:hypothetical protein
MDTFGTPETGIIAFSEESDLSRRLNFSNFKNNWRVSVLGIIDHSIKLLDKSEVYLLILTQVKRIKFVLVLFGL